MPRFFDGKRMHPKPRMESRVAGFWNGTVEHRNTLFIRKLTGQSIRPQAWYLAYAVCRPGRIARHAWKSKNIKPDTTDIFY